MDHLPPAAADVPGVEVRHLRRGEGVELKVIDVGPQSSTPFHAHAHAHDAVIVAGNGTVRLEDEEHMLGPGDVLSIAPKEPHAILGRGPDALRFVCLDSLTE